MPFFPPSKQAENDFHEIRSQLFLRLISLAKISWLSSKIQKQSQSSESSPHLEEQTKEIAAELGRLKGSVMKVGQTLAVYGEHFFPENVNQVMKTLHNQSEPVPFCCLQPILEEELPATARQQLEIDPTPIAAASLGQVHRAICKKTQEALAIKIQYPTVEKAVTNDIKTLKALSDLSRFIPKVPNFNHVASEVEALLHLELDYNHERANLERFRQFLNNDPRYLVPKSFAHYSSRRVLTMSLHEGVKLDSEEVSNFSQKQRDAIGETILDLYFREIFEFHQVQTDAHFGNYAIDPQQPERLILYDFGAVHKFNSHFVKSYRQLTRAALNAEDSEICCAAHKIGFLGESEEDELIRLFCEFCYLIVEPFRDQKNGYNWAESHLPKRLATVLQKIIDISGVRPPPQDIIFVDRKVSGVFTCLAALNSRLSGSKVLTKYL